LQIKIFKEVRNSTDCNQVQADLDKLVLWAQNGNWNSVLISVGGRDDKSTCTYYMEGKELTKVSSEKDLGVWISADLKCSKQCMCAFNKATKVLVMIKRTIRFKGKTVIMSLYKTLVRPHVEYCISAWNPHYMKDKELLEKVQRRFTKMINNMKRKTCEERLHCLKLWTLEARRNRQDLI